MEATSGLYAAAAELGWAVDGSPGFVYTLDLDGAPVVRQRLHWVACEAVLAADSLHRRTGDPRFAADAERWWQHIADNFLDTRSGGWWQELDPSLRPSATIWPGKADLYHSYQALLLPSLPLAPSAATALVQQSPWG
jgi:mannose/cellobiose epimerase-like protein (N-acyl-D-glucosamine 2-epimerase family)